ncbi:LOW QUALITY PROTEIN: probable pectinesterase/pectinesterase inhibitor 46 [Phalaenopsis equestris]|uniref:LOW QUALITY PROTEIN: probable pectinesterase/pectinesterase inhibitor 46 n=1 Tax=Phalaenopsis equestris TaxID=78828 RepID=UPI0009E5921B|nr:LOW QUALITY PROTEIN: probable pectinesterase/pectinesterase inhibitor 46 [Phalaenopsis equestris]
MPSFSSYGIISEQDQLGSGRRKSRNRLAIISLSSIVLIAIITVAILASNHGSDTAAAAVTSDSSLQASVKAMCSTTLYPDSCYTSLVPVGRHQLRSLDPTALFRIAVQAAKNAISISSKLFDDPKIKEGIKSFTISSISDCSQLLSLAAAHIEDCTASPANFTSDSFVDDLKTWLSAAITDQDTCLDGLGNDLGQLKGNIAEAMKNSTEITSNSLSILNQIADFVGSVDLRRRRRLMNWMSNADRRVLKSSGDLKYNANVVVARDGSGKYKSITAALAEAPKKSSKKFVIYVKKGVYYENVRVEQNMWNVVIVGDGMDATMVSGRLNFVDGTPTFSSATFAVFGKGFIAIDMAFQNTAGAIKQQAVAVLASADLVTFYRCKFDGYQDTLYAHSLRQFYRECNIFGTVDFIFGNAASLFQSCNILPRLPLHGQQDTITAQGKIDPNQNTGISIHNCTIWPAENLTSVSVYLGRPWKPYSTTVFMRSTMAGIINPAGWLPWLGTGTPVPDTIFYSEYQNFGPGASLKNRVKWKGLRVMDSKQAAKFTLPGFIKGSSWIPKTELVG